MEFKFCSYLQFSLELIFKLFAGAHFPSVEDRVWVPPNPEASSNENHADDAMDTSDDVKCKFKNSLSDNDIDKFLIVARSVGTFARALDCSSSVKQPRWVNNGKSQ